MRPIAACLAVLLVSAVSFARELTFEQRVAAQAAIERVYHAHQIGTTKSFEEAVPRDVLEQKVRTYLRQSAALASEGKSLVRADALEGELRRMADGTQMPDRLRELFQALGNDSFLIQECLARPALVERLSRDLLGSAEIAAGDFDPGRVEAVASASVALPPVRGAKTEFSPSSCAANDTWDNGRLGTATEARTEHTAVWTGSLMIVWGGKDQVSFPAAGHRYDPATDTWSSTSMLNAPRARIGHTAVWTGSVMIVYGGYDTLDNGSPHYWDGAKYDPVADTWQPIAPAFPPAPRAYHTAVWTGSRMIVWGGGPVTAGALWNTGAAYDPGTDTWTPTSTIGSPSARYRHTAVWTGSWMIVWGGHTDASTDSSPVNTGAMYDPVSDTWVPTNTGAAPSPRGYHVAVWTGFEMVVWGGGSPVTNTGGRYNPFLNTWLPMTGGGAPAPRRLATAVWTGSRMFVFGGNGGSPVVLPLNTGGLYDPAADAWLPTSTTNAPSPRRSHTAVWTGSEAIIWGGEDLGGQLKTGGRYSSSTHSWVPITSDATPRARLGPTAVWTGTHMIVWGGGVVTNLNTVSLVTLKSGGRYDPALDLWTPTNVSAAPAPRIYHSAVWTGDRMIVWGGASDNTLSTVLATGGIYDPTLDTWVATPAGPSARNRHAAVWTGNRMMIWGGRASNGTYLASGSLFDPVLQTWSVTTTVGAPSGRHQIGAAIWTGTRVLLWGSENPSTTTGGLYDPVADAWTATSLVGAPPAENEFASAWAAHRLVAWSAFDDGDEIVKTGGRYDPETDTWASIDLGGPITTSSQTVSTGNRMIVWGGTAGGAIYDAVADTWTPTSITAAPVARSLYASVWTGDSMIVWGGMEPYPSDVPLVDGGRYIGLYPDDADGDGFTGCDGDCDDTRADVHPGAPELCDRLDNDCSGGVPANELDTDLDGYSGCNGDCNDGSSAVHPGAPEVCDGLDNDCNGSVAGEADADGDGWRLCNGDCDDAHATVRPGAPPLCDGLENNCSAPTWPAVPGSESDDDGDHYVECVPWSGSVAGVTGGGDCDDTNATRYPRAPELNNGLDEQCPGDPGRGVIDEVSGTSGFFSLGDKTLYSWPPQSGATSYEIVRSRFASFNTGCFHATTVVTSYSDPVIPAPGGANFYLVRSLTPYQGSWGQNAALVERHPCAGCLTTGDWCDDQSVCTLSDACVGTVCTGSPLSCDDGNPCTNDSCDPVTGCAHTNNTSACNDGNACTTGDVCGGGVCQPGSATNCNDSNVCTDDSCSPATGCAHANNTAACDDGNACTTGDACGGGVCQPGSATNCNDSNVCTDDSCSPATGCAHANNTAACDDGNACTSGDVCAGGVCAGTIAGLANHLVISQIQTAGDPVGNTNDEFVELYNPTSAPVSLASWSLQSVTASFPFNADVQVLSGTIPAHGWFLLAPVTYNGATPRNLTLSIPLGQTSGNLELVNSTAEITSCTVGTIVDKVGYGPTPFCTEGTTPPAPAANNSVLRKPGGACGNGVDTNVNSADFVSQIPSTPRNASSPPQP